MLRLFTFRAPLVPFRAAVSFHSSAGLLKKTETVKSKKSKKSKPEGPIKPISAYASYVKQVFSSVKSDNPHLSFADISKKVSEQWKELAATEKQSFLDDYEKAKQVYEKEKAATARPKRPISAFFYYAAEHRPAIVEENPFSSFGDIAKIIGDKWKELSDSDKAPYVKKAEDDKKRYESEVAKKA